MIDAILERARAGQLPTHDEAIALADFDNTRALADVAAELRDREFHNVVT